MHLTGYLIHTCFQPFIPAVFFASYRGVLAISRLSFLFAVAVYCKDSLCRKETFVQLTKLLTKDDAPLKQKRVSVYLLSVLVANNSRIMIHFYIKSAFCAHLLFLLYCALQPILFLILFIFVASSDVYLLDSLPSVDRLQFSFFLLPYRVRTDVGKKLWLSVCFIGTFQVLYCP